MKIAKRIKIYFCVAAAILLACLSVIFMERKESVNAFAAEESASEQIYVGDTIEAAEYDISVDSSTVKAEGFSVVYPSGGLYYGDSFVVQQAGWYEVTYYATVDGQRVEETQKYFAIRRAKDIIVSENGATVSLGKYEVESPYELKKDTYGAVVEFQASESITFTTNIKTEKLTKDYTIIDMIVMPSVFKETDFEVLVVKVADAEDPDNYVEINIKSSSMVDGDGQVSYVKAGANGQRAGGYEGSKYHTLNYGTQVEHSFRGLGRASESRKNLTVSETSLTISIDNAERRVYCGPYSHTSADKLLVNDLDDVTNFKGNPWGGFTSDEVTVQVTASSFSKSTGKVVVKSYGDYDLSQDVVDDAAPELVLHYDENAVEPVAVLNQSFPIIPFSVKDNFDKQLKIDVSVYHVGEDGTRINVDCDGESFFVKYTGEYEIVYSAEDWSGNKKEIVKTISVVENMPEVFISLDNPEIEAQAYETVQIPLASEIAVFGGSGKLAVERTVYSPKKEVLDVKNSLLLTQLGEYKVVYKVTDYLNNVYYGVITVSSTETSEPIFTEEPAFEKILIKGFTYELPKASVIEAVNGEVVNLPYSVYVNDKLVDGSFTADGEKMEIRYVVEGETGTKEWATEISVADTDYGKYKNEYFYIENGIEIINEKSNVQLSFANDGSVEFVKALYSSEFSALLTYEGSMVNFSKMTVLLEDASDRSKAVSIHFYYDKADDAWFIQKNGEKAKIEYTTSKGSFNFLLSADGAKVIDSSGDAAATITAYDDGEPFEGFSDALYFSLSFEGVSSESTINISKIGNQSMGYEKSSIDKALDEIEPVIVLSGEFQIRQKLGQKANIPTAYASDVLGQIVEFTVTVTKSGGGVVASGPASKPLDLTLSEAGNYLVTYYALDSNGNERSLPYVMIVRDETAPTLSVSNTLKKEYSLGSNVTIPTCTAKDNGDNCYVQIMLILPNNEMRLLQYIENGKTTSMLNKENELYNDSFKVNSNTFKVEEKGKYILRVLAYDEYYNRTAKEIEFTVK